MTTSYKIYVDWNNDGDFSDANEDITTDVLSIDIERGKDEELAESIAATCQLKLKDITNKYSPERDSNILPRRRIRVRAIYNSSEADLFNGFISEIIPHPHWNKQFVYIYCVDGIDVLANAEITTPLYEDQKTGYLIAEILALAAWSEGQSWILGVSKLDTETILGFSPTNIDTGQDTVPYAWWHRAKALQAIRDLENSELGFFYINADGKVCWEDRHHRLKSPHTISQATFDDTMVDIAYAYRDKDIKNDINAIFIPRTVGSVVEIWRLRETPLIQAGATETWEAAFSDPCKDVVTPASTTDYTANTAAGGGGTDKTGDISISFTCYAAGARLAVTNGASEPVYITLLKIRGKKVTDQENITRIAFDTTSQRAYQKRTLSLAGKFIRSGTTAQDFANYALSRYKDPQPEISIDLMGPALISEILTRHISDRITVKNTKLGLDDDFFINKVTHNIGQAGNYHKVQWILGRASDEEYWCLGTSKLDTETRLAY